MGSYINFKNFGATTQPEGSGYKPSGNFPLARQSSVYSLTFDELQNTLDGVGKDFGSMNMDELLKNIWTAEGTQPMLSSSGVEGIAVPSGNLQSQGSLTLPRTLSQKTVEEVWRDLLKESENLKDGSGNGGANLPQRQATLGEMTLEEFLLRAGVVGETTQPIGRPINGGFYGEIPQNNSNAGLTLEFQPPARNHEPQRNGIIENNSAVHNLSPNLALDAHGIISQQQLQQQQHRKQQQQQQQQQQLQQQQHRKQQQHQQQQQHHQQQQPLFPRQATLAFASPMNLVNNAQLATPGTRGPIMGRADPSMNNSAVQTRVIQNGAMDMAGLAPRVTPIVAGSPKNQLTSNMIHKSDVETSSLSPLPYAFNEGARGRKPGGTLEKVVERRRRRMIKNRESAARSRARKQAYTLELEAEVAKLKEDNEDMQKKQEEFMETQKNQILEKMKMRWKSNRLCLRRTLTGPW